MSDLEIETEVALPQAPSKPRNCDRQQMVVKKGGSYTVDAEPKDPTGKRPVPDKAKGEKSANK